MLSYLIYMYTKMGIAITIVSDSSNITAPLAPPITMYRLVLASG